MQEVPAPLPGAGGSPAAAAAAAAAALNRLESAGACDICHSLYDTPLALSGCGHSCE